MSKEKTSSSDKISAERRVPKQSWLVKVGGGTFSCGSHRRGEKKISAIRILSSVNLRNVDLIIPRLIAELLEKREEKVDHVNK